MKKSTLLLFALLCALPSISQEKLTVFFYYNQYDFNPETTEKLESWVAANKDSEILKIYGYCDERGDNSYNDKLSLQRVASVHDFLKSKNIKIAANYQEKGFGEDFKKSDVHADNRKVTIFYKKYAAPEVKPVAVDPVVSAEKPEAVAEVVPQKTLTEQVKESKAGDKIKLDNIYFYNMSPMIVPTSEKKLTELVNILKDNPNLKIEVQGHICCQINKDLTDLSTLRAKSIHGYLIENGIAAERLTYKGFGVTKPIHPIPEKSAKEEDENRRVEIMIVSN